jgi:hypothetical protein
MDSGQALRMTSPFAMVSLSNHHPHPAPLPSREREIKVRVIGRSVPSKSPFIPLLQRGMKGDFLLHNVDLPYRFPE